MRESFYAPTAYTNKSIRLDMFELVAHTRTYVHVHILDNAPNFQNAHGYITIPMYIHVHMYKTFT